MIEYICVCVCMYGSKSGVCLKLRGDIELKFLSIIETVKALGIPQRGTKCTLHYEICMSL